jgi:hypothetical protein
LHNYWSLHYSDFPGVGTSALKSSFGLFSGPHNIRFCLLLFQEYALPSFRYVLTPLLKMSGIFNLWFVWYFHAPINLSFRYLLLMLENVAATSPHP